MKITHFAIGSFLMTKYPEYWPGAVCIVEVLKCANNKHKLSPNYAVLMLLKSLEDEIASGEISSTSLESKSHLRF